MRFHVRCLILALGYVSLVQAAAHNRREGGGASGLLDKLLESIQGGGQDREDRGDDRGGRGDREEGGGRGGERERDRETVTVRQTITVGAAGAAGGLGFNASTVTDGDSTGRCGSCGCRRGRVCVFL